MNWPVWSEKILPVSSTHVRYTNFVLVAFFSLCCTFFEVCISTGACVSAVGASFTGACVERNVGSLVGEFLLVDGLGGSGVMMCVLCVGCSVVLYKKYGDFCFFFCGK